MPESHPRSTASRNLLSAASLAQTLGALVRIDSVNPAYGGPQAGEGAVMDWVKEFLGRHGVDAALVDVHPGRPDLVATIRGEDAGRPLYFVTHVDTVSVQGMSIDPLGAVLRDGKLWGRGSTDAKGQVAAMLHAFVALAVGDRRPPLDVGLALTVDEEAGFTGVRRLRRYLAERGENPRGVVIGEPTALAVVVAHKGTIRWWIEIKGRAAHSALPHKGVNAIEHAASLVTLIQRDHARELAGRSHPLLGGPTINVSKISGGTQVNLVPGSARILLDRRTLPNETPESVHVEFEALIEKAAADHPGLRARQLEPFLVDPSLETSRDDPLVRRALELSERRGRGGEPLGVPYGTDGSKLAEAGLSTIVVGPGSIDQAHTADEWIDLAELEAGAHYYHELMMAGLPS